MILSYYDIMQNHHIMMILPISAYRLTTHMFFFWRSFFYRSFLSPTKQQWNVCFNSCIHCTHMAALQPITSTVSVLLLQAARYSSIGDTVKPHTPAVQFTDDNWINKFQLFRFIKLFELIYWNAELDGQNHHMLMILKSKSNHLNKGDLKSKSFWKWWFENQNHIENQMILKYSLYSSNFDVFCLRWL